MAIEFNYLGDYHNLTNKRIKGLIASASTQTIQKKILKILLCGLGVTFVLALIAQALGLLFGFFGTVFLTLKACVDANKNVELNAASMDDFWKKECFLFVSYLQNCTSDISNDRTSDYCLYFFDENGNIVKDNILKEQFLHFSDFQEGDMLIVLKYPNAQNTKYEYKAFDPELFNNVSCVKFIQQNRENIEIEKKWENNDNNEDW